MKIGVVFPQTEFPPDPIAVRDYTQTVEALGYAHVLAYEHVLGANPVREGGWHGPYTHEDPFFDPFVLFSYMAGLSDTLEFATGILILPQRQTALVAKQAATLDVLCEGRFRLGVGVGWNKVEYVALNQDFHKRGKRMDAQLPLMIQLWKDELVTHSDTQHTIPDAGLNPLPTQRRIPIWFGGHADAVKRRLAKYGAGWMPGFRTAESAVPWLDSLDPYLEAEGRTRADIGIEPRLQFRDGNADTWGKDLEGWKQVGAGHISINTMGCGFTTIAQHLDALRTFATEIGV